MKPKMKSLDVTIVVADVPNKNRRIYPRATCEAIVAQASKKKHWAGTMNRRIGTPASVEPEKASVIDLKDLSHYASNFRMEGNELKVTVDVVDTPAGHILNNMLEAEIEMAFRLFGMTQNRICEQNNNHMVVEKFKMVEIVAMPAELAA